MPQLFIPPPISAVITDSEIEVRCEGDYVVLDDVLVLREWAHSGALSASLVGDAFFCGALLKREWERRVKVFTRRGWEAACRGTVIHQRYLEYLRRVYDNVDVEYRVELSDFVGIIDAVIWRDDGAIPVEVKTGAPRDSHEAQLQLYMWLLRRAGYQVARGYLVYWDSVRLVHYDSQRAQEAYNIVYNAIYGAPKPTRDCRRCVFRRFCTQGSNLNTPTLHA